MSVPANGLRTEMLGGLRCLVVGEPRSESLAIVLLHGFGAPGGDLVPFAGAIAVPEGSCFIFPEAPLEMPWGFDSRAWWMIDMARLERALATGAMREMTDEVPDGIVEAREALFALLRDLEERHGIPLERVVLGGFSQGSMLALDVALRHERQVAGLVLWSTTLLARSEWEPLMPARAGLRAFMSHGRRDPLLPFVVSEHLRDQLIAAGWKVDWHAFGGQHEIPVASLDGASRLIREVGGLV